MKQLDKLDIVLSIYNQEKIIEKVLYGILVNTTTPFNLILVFDGCTDNTKPIALKYIKKFKADNLLTLIFRDANNVYETKANNIGFKLAKENYMITLQDDMVVKEYGWEKRLTYPLRAFDNVLGVTARAAQDIKAMDKLTEEYENIVGREHDNLPRNIFAIRDVINRGPIAFRMDYLRKLNYLDEDFAPSMLDDADLSLRAYLKYKWRVGAYWVDYESPLRWGKTRSINTTMPIISSNIKNRQLLRDRYGDYFNSAIKHTNNVKINKYQNESILDPSYYMRIKTLIHYPIKAELSDLEERCYIFFDQLRRQLVQLAKFSMVSVIVFIFEIFGVKGVRKNGIENTLLTKAGLNNGPTREKWLKQTLKKIPRSAKLLDAGAGELQYKRFCSHLDYYSQDFSEFSGANKGYQSIDKETWDTSKVDIVSDIAYLPIKNKTFDAVMCIEVLEHLPDPLAAMREFGRILKPGGKLIITAPFCSLTHMAPYYYANGFSRFWFETVLAKNGFALNEINYNGNFFEYLAQELRRVPKMEEKYTNLNITQNLYFRMLLIIVLRILHKLSLANKGSEKILCFGLHVLATKI